MSSIYEKIDNRIETFLSTLKRFPLASFSAFLISMIFLVLIDYHDYDNPSVIIASKVAFVATLGIVLFPALQLLGRSRIFYLLGILILSIYYYCLPHNINDVSQIIFTRHILLWIALFFMIIWAPFLFRKSNNDTFWQYAQSIIFGLIIAIFFSAIVYGGLSVALYAIEKLFNFDVRTIRYGQLAIIVFGIFGVNFFLSQIPKHPLFLQVPPYSKIKRIFSKNILAPITIIYFVILYAYTGKILISMTWPTGTLSWIIVAFSFVAIVSFLFLSPYLKKSSLSQRLIWLAIFLQTLMLAMALWIRIEEYGITYNRYLLAGFGVWLALMSLYFMLFGKAQQKWLFFFATIFILLSQFGAYSAKNLTKQSQTTRLIKLIETAHPRSEGLDIKTKYEISDGISYMKRHYGIDAFEKIIPHILKKYKTSQETNSNTYDFTSFATQELGFKSINQWEWKNYQRTGERVEKEDHYFYANSSLKSIDIKGYTKLINYQSNIQINKNDNVNFKILIKDNQLQVKQNDTNLTTLFDLNDYITKLTKKENSLSYISQDMLVYEKHGKHMDIKILFQSLTISYDGNITHFEGQILLKP